MVNHLKSYVVRVFVPLIEVIEAEDEADALEKVAEFYKSQYHKEGFGGWGAWIEPLPEPEDCA